MTREDERFALAELLVGEPGPNRAEALRSELAASAGSVERQERMQQTLATLRALHDRTTSEPLPRLELRATRPDRVRARSWVTAASVLFLAAWWWASGFSDDSTPREAVRWMEVAPTLQAADEGPPLPMGELAPGKPSRMGSASRGSARGDSDASGSGAIQTFLSQLDFYFVLPERLPGHLELVRARALSSERAQLLYRSDSVTFEVFVTRVRPAKRATQRTVESSGAFRVLAAGDLVIGARPLPGAIEATDLLLRSFLP